LKEARLFGFSYSMSDRTADATFITTSVPSRVGMTGKRYCSGCEFSLDRNMRDFGAIRTEFMAISSTEDHPIEERENGPGILISRCDIALGSIPLAATP
jgi:hypothetical protein